MLAAMQIASGSTWLETKALLKHAHRGRGIVREGAMCKSWGDGAHKEKYCNVVEDHDKLCHQPMKGTVQGCARFGVAH